MRVRPTRHWPVLAFLIFHASAASSQAVVTGVVREDSTGRVLAGVEVQIEETSAVARTDSAGRYTLAAPTGNHIARFRLPGYKPERLRVIANAKGDTVHADATLSRGDAQQLEAVEVKAHPTGPRGVGREAFAERRALGFGKFMDSTELRQADGRRLSEVLRGSLGIRMINFQEVIPGAGRVPGKGPVEIRAASPIKTGLDGGPCWVTVMLDGLVLFGPGAGSKPTDFSRELSVSSLESIEYYRSPAEYLTEFARRGAECGVLVLWTRRGS
jgi:hypothetical protein